MLTWNAPRRGAGTYPASQWSEPCRTLKCVPIQTYGPTTATVWAVLSTSARTSAGRS